MRKEDALKILETNIHRELCRKWLKYQSPTLAIVIVGLIVYFIPTPTIALPSSPIKIENLVPAIFTGTITATSILVGFFTVSAYNFRQWLESRVDEYFDKSFEFGDLYNKAMDKKVELEKLEKETKKKKLLEEIAKKKVEIEAEIEKCGELKELAGLNRDAYAHQQEHLSMFLFSYLAVSFLLLIGGLVTFYATFVASWIIAIFMNWTVVSLNAAFNGLAGARAFNMGSLV